MRCLKHDLLARAGGPVVELLESRTLLHGGTAIQVNFQPGAAAVPDNYHADTGEVFGDRRDGHVYGWSSDNRDNARQADSNATSDPRFQTFEYLAPDNNWEIEVENGDYTVHVVAGGAVGKPSRLKVDVEGVLTVNRTIPRTHEWAEGTQTVTVTDGRLTISAAPGGIQNRLAFVDITPWDDASEISVATARPKRDAAPGGARFIFYRTGSVSQGAAYDILIGGSARNGKDYKLIEDEVVFEPGQATTAVNITPRGAAGSLGDKVVALTVLPGADYLLGTACAAATITSAGMLSAAAGFSAVRINFQPAGSAVPERYLADSGQPFGARANGFTYGWNADNSANTRDRNSSLSVDQRYDTLIHMQRDGKFSWEIAVPNGTYTVRIVAGDAGFYDGTFRTNVEGVLAVNASPTSANRWVEGTATANVSDGRLTLTSASGAVNNKISFVEINPGSAPIPVVRAAASDGTASESGDTGTINVSRTGSLAAPLTVNYTVGGSATNGGDYQPLSGAVTFAAGVSSVNVVVKPINDSAVEPSETMTFKLSTSPVYSLASKYSTLVTIADNDTAAALKWRSVAPNLQARSEAMGATVNGKLYTFGGYIDGSYRPTARVDVYNPTTNQWTRLKDIPFPGITHSGTAVDGNFVYLAGGYPGHVGGPQTFSTTNVWKYDTVNDSWTMIQPLPSGRGAGALCRLNRTLYYVGGADSSRADRAEAFSLDLDNPSAKWVQLASMPAPRNHVGAVALGGYVYVVGGQTGQDAATVWKSDVYRYNPATNSWTTMASLINQPRSHTAAATLAYNGKIYILGGEGPGHLALSNVESYDPATNKWSSLSNLPAPRSSGIAEVIGNSLIFTTGHYGTFKPDTWIGDFS
jgi:N-acetylneuraminic acid mutarotase